MDKENKVEETSVSADEANTVAPEAADDVESDVESDETADEAADESEEDEAAA